MRQAQQYTVNVFPGVLKKLRDAEAVKEVKPETRILTLDSRYYSLLFGLSTEPVSEMEMLYVGYVGQKTALNSRCMGDTPTPCSPIP
jgi:hypothetical protein